MEEKVVLILNEMAEYLSVAQMKKLQEVMLKNLNEKAVEKRQISNEEYLTMFIAAKSIEGCSKRTLSYYKSTIETMFEPIRILVEIPNTGFEEYWVNIKEKTQKARFKELGVKNKNLDSVIDMFNKEWDGVFDKHIMK